MDQKYVGVARLPHQLAHYHQVIHHLDWNCYLYHLHHLPSTSTSYC